MDPRTDLQLVEAANGGDADALEALYLRHRDWVHGLAWRWLGRDDEAWDVTQETFRYLMSRIPGLVLTARLRTLLWPVVRSLCSERRRKGRREATLPAVDPAALDSRAARGESKEALAAVLRLLPDAHADVVLLRYVDGLSLEEIGQLLEIPLGTVKSRLHHALRRLGEDGRTKKLLEG